MAETIMFHLQSIVEHILRCRIPDAPLVAAMPMYDWPERREIIDAKWEALRGVMRLHGIPAPENLARCNADLPPVPGGIRDASGKVIAPDPATLPPEEFDLAVLWQHPNLLFAQTCHGPLRLWLKDVLIIAQDDYSAFEGGEGSLYSSALVMRRPAIDNDPDLVRLLAGLRFAYNAEDSMSGYLALEDELENRNAGMDIFSELIPSGGHRRSIRMVAAGEADIAAIDCKTWVLAKQFEPAAQALQVVAWTSKRLGLPFITGLQTK